MKPMRIVVAVLVVAVAVALLVVPGRSGTTRPMPTAS